MATTIVMPQMGYDMKEGTVVKWRKKEGDTVSRGEVIAEIETDKAVVEMESIAGGVLRKIVAPEGKVVPVGETIAIIGTPEEPIPEVGAPPGKQPETQAAAAPTQAPAAPAAPTEAATTPAGEVKASPIARRLAREKGVDLAKVQGTGPGGRITEADVLKYAEAQAAAPAAPPREAPRAAPSEAPAPAMPGGRVELSRMRQAIARRTAQSNQEIPHFYVTSEINMGAAIALRSQLNDALQGEVRVSINDMLIKAVAKTLVKHPLLNSTFRGDHLEVSPSIDIGVVVAVEEGLIVPTIRNCQSKSLVEVARASKDLIERAQKGGLRAEEMTGGTFSISNMGMFDVDNFAAIIFPGQAAMLAVGTVKARPVVKDGQLAVGQTMFATIAVDHRIADGKEAALFMRDLKQFLEQPLLLLA